MKQKIKLDEGTKKPISAIEFSKTLPKPNILSVIPSKTLCEDKIEIGSAKPYDDGLE